MLENLLGNPLEPLRALPYIYDAMKRQSCVNGEGQVCLPTYVHVTFVPATDDDVVRYKQHLRAEDVRKRVEASAKRERARIAATLAVTVRWLPPNPKVRPRIQLAWSPSSITVPPPMVYVPAGRFWMGTSDTKRGELIKLHPDLKPAWFQREQPQHKVYLDAYLIDVYPVTNEEYKKFVEKTGHCLPQGWEQETFPRGKAKHPVTRVSWEDANAYAQWAGKRLPTEAQWEKVATGGKGYIYPWGNTWDAARCCNGRGAQEGTTPVGSYPQGVSPVGCHDMAGNVWEWCADLFDSEYYQRSPQCNPTGPSTSRHGHVVRGGCFRDEYLNCRCARRATGDPKRLHLYGFRCAASP